jgi:sialic acid synthase SpsE
MLKREDIHIIAEAGTNNNGDLQKAKNLARIANVAGADSVKFQIINPWGLYLPGNYEYGHYDIEEVLKIRERGQMEDFEYAELAAHCREIDIAFSASVFDVDGLDLLMEFNPPYIKIASCDLNHTSLIREVATRNIKMIISTGMSTIEDVRKTVNELSKLNFDNFVLLHCVSAYPATLDQANLKYIKTLKNEFEVEVGFSDHTGDSIAACLALQMGATWFEKHFTEDKSQPGLDHAYAMEKDELIKYIQDITMTLEALRDEKKELSEAELYTRKRARRSLYASKDLPRGHVIESGDILVVRPEGEMNADEIDFVIGKKVNVNVKKHTGITKKYLQ